MPIQVVSENGGARKTRSIDKNQFIIGRAAVNGDADVQLEADNSISRRHLRVTVDGERIAIEDLGSSWGTRVNGQPVTGVVSIGPADRIQIGDTFLTLQRSPQHRTVILRLPDFENQAPGTAADDGLAADVNLSGDVRPDEAMVEKLAGTRHISRKQLALLYELPLHFAGEPTAESLAALILDRVIQIIPGAKRGAVLVRNRNSNKFTIAASRPEDQPPISNTLVQRCVTRRAGFIWSREEELDPSASVSNLGLQTGMYVPLMWLNQVVGVLCIDDPGKHQEFTAAELDFLMAVAQYSGAAISNLMLKQDLAQSIAMSQRLLESVSRKP